MSLRGHGKLAILAVVLLAAAAIALAVVLEPEEGSGPSAADLRGSPALNALPKTGPCLRGAGRGQEEEEFDVERIAAQVEKIRELDFRSAPEPELITTEEIDETIAELLEQAYDPKQEEIDERALIALGAIPPDADLGELRTESLEGQIAGMYDPRDDRLLVARTEDDPGLLERVTLAHELEHALADQRFGLPTNPKADFSRTDALLAEAALIEGDASLVEEIYLTGHSSPDELVGSLFSLGDLDLEAAAALPDFLQRELSFPYVAGATFVCALQRRGGWKAVNRAYSHPPTTTVEILYPDRYGTPAADPPDATAPGAGWERGFAGSFGAAQLNWLLKAPGGRREAAVPHTRAITASWGGGEVTVWTRGEATAISLAFVPISLPPGSGSDPAGLLCAGIGGWYASAFPESDRAAPRTGEQLVFDGEQDAVLRCASDDVRIGIGPDLATARIAAS